MAEEAKRRRTNEGKSPIEIQFIQDGPAVGWAVKGVGYNSGTRYFVKRADSTEWTRMMPLWWQWKPQGCRWLTSWSRFRTGTLPRWPAL
eukprot:s470_g21.t2